MNIYDAIVERKKVSKFKKEKVDDKLIGVILHMANHAHSVGEIQEWNFIVVKDDEKREKIYQASLEHPSLKDSPVIIVVCADLEKASLRFGEKGKVYAIQDSAAAAMLMLVTANALGLGSVWVSSFDEEKIKEILQIPKNLKPIALIAIGHAEFEVKKERIPFDNLTWCEEYGKKYDISYLIQPGAKRKVEIKPMGNLIEEALKKLKEKK